MKKKDVQGCILQSNFCCQNHSDLMKLGVLNEIWGLGIVLTLCKVPQGVDIQDLLTFLMDNGLGCYVT